MYTPFESYAFRLPALPFVYLVEMLSYSKTPEQLMADKRIRDIIYVASPVLHAEIEKYFLGKVEDSKKKERIILSFVKYYSRMCTRCTPFGLFASCSVGCIGSHTRFQVTNGLKRCARLDMFYLCSLAQYLSGLSEVQRQLKYFSNNSLYKVGRGYRYISYRYLNSRRMHSIASIEGAASLDWVLKKAKTGISIPEIESYFKKSGFGVDETERFVMELINSRVLVSELEPNVTGEFYFDQLAKRLNDIYFPPENKNLKTFLIEIDNILKKKNKGIESHILDDYKKITSLATILPVPFVEGQLLQVDLGRENEVAVLGREVYEELQSLISFLLKINSNEKNATLNSFQREFYDRYEEQEVPLALVLDPELGIGYPVSHGIADISPLIEQLFLPLKSDKFTSTTMDVSSLLLGKLLEMQQSGEKEIVLTPDDLKGEEGSMEKLPNTIYAMVQIAKNGVNDFLLNVKSIGAFAANLLSRFSHLCPELENLVIEITRKEQELTSEGILAELVHLPNSRVGNILSRPHIRDCEIVYLAHSDLPENRQMNVSDLLLSCHGGELILRSKKMGKRVFPRLTNAHNYYLDTLPIYRFLGDMQYYNERNIYNFNWGNLGNLLDFRPRIRYRKMILSLASWTVNLKEINSFFLLDEENLLERMSDWRVSRAIPKYVILADGDNELFVDMSSVISLKALYSVVKKRRSFIITEFFFSGEEWTVCGEEGGYTNEFIIPFYRRGNE